MKRPIPHPFLAAGPVAMAHRGGAEEAPENTMGAFRSAAAMGYLYMETDVHVTRDGVVVAFHDDRLDRVTDRAGSIRNLTIAEVEAADAGYTFTLDGGATHPFRGTGESVPRLEALFEEFPQAQINIDAKSDDVVVPLLALLHRLDAFDRVCLASFSDRRLARMRRLSQGRACTSMGRRAVTLARLASRTCRVPRQGADCVQAPSRAQGIAVIDQRMVNACHRAGLPVHVWTVNSAEAMRHLLDMGVDGIMTNRPSLLASVFEQRGLPLNGRAEA